MDLAASIKPLSSWRSAFSTRRAMNGTAAMTKGTIMAVEPRAVPMKNRVTGMTKIASNRNGIDRVMLTYVPKSILMKRFW